MANATTTTTLFAMSASVAALRKAAVAGAALVVEVIPLPAALDITLPAVAREGRGQGLSQDYRRKEATMAETDTTAHR